MDQARIYAELYRLYRHEAVGHLGTYGLNTGTRRIAPLERRREDMRLWNHGYM